MFCVFYGRFLPMPFILSILGSLAVRRETLFFCPPFFCPTTELRATGLQVGLQRMIFLPIHLFLSLSKKLDINSMRHLWCLILQVGRNAIWREDGVAGRWCGRKMVWQEHGVAGKYRFSSVDAVRSRLSVLCLLNTALDAIRTDHRRKSSSAASRALRFIFSVRMVDPLLRG